MTSLPMGVGMAAKTIIVGPAPRVSPSPQCWVNVV